LGWTQWSKFSNAAEVPRGRGNVAEESIPGCGYLKEVSTEPVTFHVLAAHRG